MVRESINRWWYFSCWQNILEENSIKVWWSCFVILLDLPSNPAVFHKAVHTRTAQKQPQNSWRRDWGQLRLALVRKPQSTSVRPHTSPSVLSFAEVGLHFLLFVWVVELTDCCGLLQGFFFKLGFQLLHCDTSTHSNYSYIGNWF